MHMINRSPIRTNQNVTFISNNKHTIAPYETSLPEHITQTHTHKQ